MKESREHPRKNSSISATFTLSDRTCSGAVSDLSKGGAFIKLDENVPVGEKLQIHIRYLSVDQPFAVCGEVVSRRPDGIGVKFDALSPEQESLLSFLYW